MTAFLGEVHPLAARWPLMPDDELDALATSIKTDGLVRVPRLVIYRAAERPPLASLNRYPGQVIGVAFRWPGNRVLSLVWARPSRVSS